MPDACLTQAPFLSGPAFGLADVAYLPWLLPALLIALFGPPVLKPTLTRLRSEGRRVRDTRVYPARGADEEAELIKRIDRARVAINIRAHARFTDGVFAACKNLKMVSIWGTGTDNIDLDAAGRHGVTVCNTPGVNAFLGTVQGIYDISLKLIDWISSRPIPGHAKMVSVITAPVRTTPNCCR